MPDDTTAKIAEQARAFLAWAKQETHDGLFFPEALPELKERVARILYGLAQADRAGKQVEGAARLWGFVFKKEDPKEQERFRDSFQGGEPTDETFRYLQRTDFLSDVPPHSVDLISREGALKYGYAGRGAVARLLKAVKDIAPEPADQLDEQRQQAGGYTLPAVREMTGLANNALSRYAKLAGVKTPLRGQRNFRYSVANVRAILEKIIAETSEDTLRAKCQTKLQDLREIAE